MTDTPSLPRPARPCPDCGVRVQPPATRCPAHTTQRNAEHNKRSAKYQTTAWRKQRLRIINRDFHACVLCGKATALQVHHLDHDAHQEVSDTRLVTLCASHHSRLEREHQQGKSAGPYHQQLDQHMKDSPAHSGVDPIMRAFGIE